MSLTPVLSAAHNPPATIPESWLTQEFEDIAPGFSEAREFWQQLKGIPKELEVHLRELILLKDTHELPQNKLDVLAALSFTNSGRWAIRRLFEHAEIPKLINLFKEKADISLSAHDGAVNIEALCKLRNLSLSQALATEDRNITLHIVQSLAGVDLSKALLPLVSFLSYNVWGVPPISGYGAKEPSRFKKIAQALADSSYDIMGLQELWDPRTLIILETLKEAGYQIIAPNVGSLRGNSGLAIATRLPVLSTSSLTFQATAGIERNFGVKKGVLSADLLLGDGTEARFSTTHLISPPASIYRSIQSDAEADAVRVKQIEEWQRWSKETLPPKHIEINTGDMNCLEFSNEHTLLENAFGVDLQRLRYPFETLSKERSKKQTDRIFSNTFVPYSKNNEGNIWAEAPPHDPSRLDYIFIKAIALKNLALKTSLAFNKKENTFSDHYAVCGHIFT